MEFRLTNAEKKFLLQLARRSIKSQLQGDRPPDDAFFSSNLETKAGAFVTLHKKGELRGCIGYVEAFMPLQEAIISLAVSAAFNDPRFAPLQQDEYDQIDLEISVLTPLEVVEDVSHIRIGRHGLVIQQGVHKGLLLPQVATEYGWDVSTFLEQTCRKAGLPAMAWKDADSTLYCFEALIFSEGQFSLPLGKE